MTGRNGIPISMETYRAARDVDTLVAVKHSVADAPAAAELTNLGYAVSSECWTSALRRGLLAAELLQPPPLRVVSRPGW